MKRKVLVSAALASALALAPAAAWANDCVNTSRPGGDDLERKGRWISVPIPELGGNTWVFEVPENFQNGKAHALLENSGACNEHRLAGQTGGSGDLSSLNGIWSEDCVIEASGS